MIYAQTRVGQNGRPFTLYKIETIRDGRIVRPRLRRWGLDEIPQIVNILRGEMDLFGPRPELPEVHAAMSRNLGSVWDGRLRARPGVLSLAATCGRIRTADRYDLDVKAEQAVLDNMQIERPWRARWIIMRRLCSTLRRGQP